MSRKNLNDTFQLFTPKVVRKLTTPGQSLYEKSLADISEDPTFMSSTGSFANDPIGSPIKSTQQLPVDFSKFESHSFFSSAEANVNICFQKIINDFPFDGKKSQYNDFVDGLTGFEKYVLDNYPSYKGFLHFSSASNQFISVKDKEGILFPGLSRNRSGKSVLSPKLSSFTVEGLFSVTPHPISDNVICQLMNENNNVGWSIFSDGTTFTGSVTVDDATVSGTIILTDGTKTVTFTSNAGSAAAAKTDATNYTYGIDGVANAFTAAARIYAAIALAKSNNDLAITATEPGSQSALIKLAQDTRGPGGDTSITGTALAKLSVVNFSNERTANIRFAIVSGSQAVTASVEVERGKFNHLAFVYDRKSSERRALIYSGSTLLSFSGRVLFPSLNTEGADLLIGSGSSFKVGELGNPDETFTPKTAFSGSINEFRYFSRARTLDELRFFSERNVYATDDLSLYFRFNEPTGSYTNKTVVLDHGGSSLHSQITNYTDSMRSLVTASLPRQLVYEDEVHHPVLFPSSPDVINYNAKLLSSASQYDSNNPNLITKLIPAYLLDTAAAYGEINDDPNGSLMDGLEEATEKTDFPGGAKLGQAQIISSLLFVWSREFDNLKTHLDQVSNLIFCEYDDEKSAPDSFLPFVADYYGLALPEFFQNTSDSQFKKGSYIQNSGMSELALRQVRSKIWRRILANLRDVVTSKGTSYAIRSMFRACGIEPSRYLRFVEYGGTVRALLGEARENITETGFMTYFSGSFDKTNSSNDPRGFSQSSPYMVGHPLSGSRIQPGFPEPRGHFLITSKSNGKWTGTTQLSDGLFTSGSWTLESRCLIEDPLVNNLQSIIRLQTEGTGSVQPLLMNLVANKQDKKVTLYYRPVYSHSAPFLELPLTGVNVFNGDPWALSVTRKRGDEFVSSRQESEITLRASRQIDGKLFDFYVTSSIFQDADNPTLNMFQNVNSDVNHNGAFFVIGSQSLGEVGPLKQSFLNSIQHVTASAARYSGFDGKVTGIRFWSKALTEEESLEHARDFRSLGVENPNINFNFVDNMTGSFGQLRLDVSMDQPLTGTNSAGKLSFVDFSQTFVSGAMANNFEKNKTIIMPQVFRHSILSPHIDEAPAASKIRIVGLDEPHLAKEFGRIQGPGYRILPDQTTVEDNRFSIEFSMMGPLNEDIIRIFATLDYLDDALGAPELKFASEYKGLATLRQIYFNKLSSTMNYSGLFEYFRFLDDSFDSMIDLLIPRSTDYLGFNFIIENHILERFKYCYQYGDVYLGENNRRNLKGSLLLRQLVGDIGRYI